MPVVMRTVQDEIATAFRGNKFFTVKPGRSDEIPDVPMSLTEPDDMQIVASPCHGYEPVKVPDDTAGPYYCLLCGEPFAV